jgi:hypothetical protein
MRSTPSQSAPTCDGTRILFDITEAGEVVPCAISRMALEDMTQGRCFKPADMLKSFARVRDRVEALAAQKFRDLPEGVTGRLSLWSDDVIDPDAEDVPALSQLGAPTV